MVGWFLHGWFVGRWVLGRMFMACGIFLPKVLVGCGWRGVGVWIMGGWWVVVGDSGRE